jgi:hypothetical protein
VRQAAEQLLQVLARGRVECAQDLVELGRRKHLLGGQDRTVLQPRIGVPPRRDLDVGITQQGLGTQDRLAGGGDRCVLMVDLDRGAGARQPRLDVPAHLRADPPVLQRRERGRRSGGGRGLCFRNFSRRQLPVATRPALGSIRST